jgi:hypothetical protein
MLKIVYLVYMYTTAELYYRYHVVFVYMVHKYPQIVDSVNVIPATMDLVVTLNVMVMESVMEHIVNVL